MKKFLLIAFLILILSVGGFFLWQYIKYKRNPDPYKTFIMPKVEFSVIEITSMTEEQVDMNVSVLIKNQLPFAFTADSLEYELYINDTRVMKSRYKESLSMEGNDSSWIKLPVTVYSHDADSLIDANENRGIDSAEYRMNTSFRTDLMFDKKLSVTVKRYLPLIHTPDMTVDGIDVDSLNLKRAVIVVKTKIKNDNVFDIRVKNYAYEMQIEDHDLVKGKIDGTTILRKKSTTDITVPVTVSFKEFGKTLFELLKHGKNINYNLTLNLIIDTDVDMVRNSKAVIKSSGSVKSLLKAAKGLKDEEK